ncbi:MAG: hypothetical protein QM523_05040 [Candidatus Pacebacteria bacterium]|nr:hypothetical protein [Candidatus Paceibacterota bacterium]
MSIYRTKKWRDYRKQMLELKGEICEICGLDSATDEKTLQIHHIEYFKGRKPWEYSHDEVSVLCMGCHSKIHGNIPNHVWSYVGEYDRGDLVGSCQACGRDIRYEHYVDHNFFGEMILGKFCAERILENKTAMQIAEYWYLNKSNPKLQSFVNSTKWKNIANRTLIFSFKFYMSLDFKVDIVLISHKDDLYTVSINYNEIAFDFPYISIHSFDLLTAKKIAFMLRTFMQGLPKKEGGWILKNDEQGIRYVLERNLTKFMIAKSKQNVGYWMAKFETKDKETFKLNSKVNNACEALLYLFDCYFENFGHKQINSIVEDDECAKEV